MAPFPLIEEDNSPLARVYTDFQKLGQQLLSEGVELTQVVDQGPVDVTLLFRTRQSSDPMSASTWAAELQRTFAPDFPSVLLLAGADMLARFMRWLTSPTVENYANIPAMMRPTPLQRLIPHPASVDVIAMPFFRDAVIHNTKDFIGIFARAGLGVFWPLTVNYACYTEESTGRIFITPAIFSTCRQSQTLGHREKRADRLSGGRKE